MNKLKIKLISENNLKYPKRIFIINQEEFLINGDFWHGNPNIFKKLSERQVFKQKDDKIKNRIAKENKYDIIRFWEIDINKNFDFVKNKIMEKINEKKLF